MAESRSFGIVVLIVVMLSLGFAFRQEGILPAARLSVHAVRVGDSYFECGPPSPLVGNPCQIYDKDAKVVEGGSPFTLRLKAVAEINGEGAENCGKGDLSKPDHRKTQCALEAFAAHKPFWIEYLTDFGPHFFVYGYGIASDGLSVNLATYDDRGFPDATLPHTELIDGNRVRLVRCITPVKLVLTNESLPTCEQPINRDASLQAASDLSPINTSICEIAKNPEQFNNKIVRVKGAYSGNFEYSELTSDECPQGEMWFEYGSGEAPPGLVAHIPGGASPGNEDANGWLILPVPVTLVKDQNFEKFQNLMRERALKNEQADKSSATEPDRYRVVATFVGRVDSVSKPVHEFHLRKSVYDRADYLGFGQMGLLDSEFVMQSVESDALLEKKPK